MNISLEAILTFVGAIVLGILLIRLGRQITLALMGLGVVGALVVGALALFEQAQASREAAKAAKVTAVGQTVESTTLTLLISLLVVVVILAAIAVIYFWLRPRRMERWLVTQQCQRPGQWAPGPNARWRQTGVGGPLVEGTSTQRMLEQLMQLETLRLLRDMRMGWGPSQNLHRRYGVPERNCEENPCQGRRLRTGFEGESRHTL